jgi:16S rRNA C967 or C1407 C5-methylase (RsmB/RsmF family)/NOL1/NOP2/fmu family ribosome biogenesis protein
VPQPLPHSLLDSLEGIPGFDRKPFEDVHASGEQVTSLRINPAKGVEIESLLSEMFLASSDTTRNNKPETRNPLPVPWSRLGYYLPQRPSFTFDPLFHAGCYYVQEASSMFLEQAFVQLADVAGPLKVLDLSAAPGGKSTHIQSLITPDSLLVSNEVIRNRSLALMDNIVKWGAANVVITNNDPSAFRNYPEFFDVMVVDAPCSGSGLFRRDPDAVDEWSLNNVALCSQRQQRILADALPALKEGGLLVYSTCSYSKEEDEEIAHWLEEEFGMEHRPLEIDASWGIVTADKGYRFYPDKLRGEGFFMACFRKGRNDGEARLKPVRVEKATAKERSILQSWLRSSGVELMRNNENFFAFPASLVEDFQLLLARLNVVYKGVALGSIMKERLVPEHALALSAIIGEEIPSTELDRENAILYLQRKDLHISPGQKGWQLVTYKKHPLGWINALPNRINNYYPKEMRILKERIEK